LNKVTEFIEEYLENISEVINQEAFIKDFYETLSVGAVNQSFLIDFTLMPHEMLLLKLSPKKGFTQIDESTEKMMITISILVKLVIFNILLQLERNKEWKRLNE
jgi:hypothetical protein